MKRTLLRVSRALQRRIVPDLEYSQTQFERYLWRYGPESKSWLDLGCGHRMLPEWRAESERDLLARAPFVVGIDYDLPSLQRHRSISLRARASATRLPFADGAFDLVTANMVVEHLDDPAQQFREVARVLRPGGIFLFHTPNRGGYSIRVARLLPDAVKRTLAAILESRAEEDVFPTYYRANTRTDVADIATRSGFEVDSIDAILTSPVFQVVPPLVVLELLLIRQIQRPSMADLRPDLICVLRRTSAAP
jgi:SAM-dependent methyltransferase